MKKRGLVLIALLILFSIFIVYAQTRNSGKLILNDDNSIGRLVSSDNLSVGDIFYLDDGRKARVTSVEDIVSDSDSNFDNLNFFANGVLVHNKLTPKVLATVVGKNTNTGHRSISVVYDMIDSSNVDKVFTNPLSPNFRGTKVVVYKTQNGDYVVAFFTESADTHHVQVGAKLAELDGWNKCVTGAYYERNFEQGGALLHDQWGFELRWDVQDRKIIKVEMGSAITNSQYGRGIQFDKSIMDDVAENLFRNIDQSLLSDQLKDFNWLNNPDLVEQITPRSLIKGNPTLTN